MLSRLLLRNLSLSSGASSLCHEYRKQMDERTSSTVMIACMIISKWQRRGPRGNRQRRLEEPEMASHFAGGDTVIDAQLTVNALHLCANGRDGNHQGLRNLRVRIASGKQAQHLLFLPAELCREQRRIWRDGKALFHARGGRHVQDGLAIGAQRCLAQGEGLQEGDQGIAFIQETPYVAFTVGLRERHPKPFSRSPSLLPPPLALRQEHLDREHAADASRLPRRIQQA